MKKIDELHVMINAVRAAQMNVERLAHEIFAPGTKVAWLYKDKYTQHGEVVTVVGGWWASLEVRVKNLKTGKVVDIYVGLLDVENENVEK
jgi:hypothetical protein